MTSLGGDGRATTGLQPLVERGEAKAVAIAGRGRPSMSYAQLRDEVDRAASVLKAAGVRGGDAVALSMPNGPETAVMLLAVTQVAAVAPLNPAYRASEVAFALDDLRPRLLVCAPDMADAARVAHERGIPVVVVRANLAGPAGSVQLEVGPPVDVGHPFRGAAGGAGKVGHPFRGAEDLAAVAAYPDDVALLLHTSGTTARPKLVGLTHAGLLESASRIAATLQLTPGDVCLDIMPLFHVHGLIGGLFASLAAGATAWCAPGFNALQFFSWLTESRATWYTAVPTMHQAILGRAKGNAEALGRHRLRFARSSSSPLPDAVWDEVEETFGIPMLNAYGMTEAHHQIACIPPDGRRVRGSVGPSAGPEIAIMDGEGRLLPRGAAGEIVLRGATIVKGYLQPAAANATAFVNGWFRTGDEGRLGEDGYVTLTGRLKEMINCGGEKVSPYEVEEAFLAHPAVAQAVAFAIAHPKLGEEVGAAVVMREGREADERALRRFAGDRLAGFKMPRRLLVLPELPKGPTGKLQRIGLAKVLGVD